MRETCCCCPRPACLETEGWVSPLCSDCWCLFGEPSLPPDQSVTDAVLDARARANTSGAFTLLRPARERLNRICAATRRERGRVAEYREMNDD